MEEAAPIRHRTRNAIGDSAWTITIFALLAATSVAVPVLASLLAPRASAHALSEIRIWLVRNNATIMTVLFAVLAAQNVGAGVSMF